MKLASVASEVFGHSGGEMLRALIEGEANPKQMATLARGQFRQKLHGLALPTRSNTYFKTFCTSV